MKRNVNDSFSSSVPIIDIGCLSSSLSSAEEKEEEMKKLKSALNSWGLFQAIGHGIPQSLLDDVCTVSKQFFELSMEDKQKYTNDGTVEDLQGYGSDRIVSDDQILDWCDRLFLLVEPQEHRSLQFWPEFPSDFRRTLHEYSVELSLIAELVLSYVASLANLKDDYFIDKMGKKAPRYAAINYYPPCSRPDHVYGMKPHTDGGAITITLQANEVEGLQILKDENWIKVPIIQDALLINIGDQMEIMTNGLFKSPLHRVVTNAATGRISLAMFYSPEFDREIEPAAELINDTNSRIFRKVKVKDYLDVFFPSYLQGKRALDWAKVKLP